MARSPAAALLAALAVSTAAAAEPGRLELSPAADGAVLTLAALGFGGSELLKQQLAPPECRWCESPAADGRTASANNFADAFFHDALTLRDRKAADTASNVVGFVVFPAAALTAAAFVRPRGGGRDDGLKTMFVVAESAAVSGALVQLVKFSAARNRPFVHYGHVDTSGTYDGADRDAHLSFPSGHTALVASVGFGVASAAQVQGSSAAPWLWAGAGAATALTGALRMMAEKHWFTDVLAGAAIGAGSGVLVPLLHRQDLQGQAGQQGAVTLSARGPSLVLSGLF